MDSYKLWKCSKCKKWKRTETSIKDTYCVKCSKWFVLLEEKTERSYMSGRVETFRGNTFGSRHTLNSDYQYMDTVGKRHLN